MREESIPLSISHHDDAAPLRAACCVLRPARCVACRALAYVVWSFLNVGMLHSSNSYTIISTSENIAMGMGGECNSH